ncbi:MAG: glycosyltransferase family 4 protein [Candidatus Dormibacteraeota bacterium]|nr:glycosyltransferase family 4 protein [Candidatus Dormibacteraeota bacterium]
MGGDLGVTEGIRAHYDARRPGWQLLDVAGRVRERVRYAQTGGRETRSAAARDVIAAPAGLYRPAADRRPRVLVCDRYVPTPDRDAGSARMAWMLRLLASLCAHVTFVPVRQFAYAEYAAPLRQAGVEVLVGHGRSLDRLLAARAGVYDVVVLSRTEVANRCAAAVRRHQPRARVIFDTVELASTRLYRQRSIGAGGGSVSRERRLEDRAIRHSHVVAAVSAAECNEIARRRCGAHTVVLPLVYCCRPTRPAFDERRDLLFVGNFTHAPNADAVRWFAAAVLPRIRRDADLRLRVAGPGASAKTVGAWGSHVTYEGWVPDLRPLLDAARVAVAPLRYGAGVKGKVGEALAMGLPCVATSIAAEGLELVHGTHLLVADDAAGFAAAVLRAYTDPHTWGRLANAGVDVAAERWSPQAMNARLTALLSETLGMTHMRSPVDALAGSSPTVQLSVT